MWFEKLQSHYLPILKSRLLRANPNKEPSLPVISFLSVFRSNDLFFRLSIEIVQ